MSAVPRTTVKSGLAWFERNARSEQIDEGHGRVLPGNSRARNRSRSRRRRHRGWKVLNKTQYLLDEIESRLIDEEVSSAIRPAL